MVFLPEKQEAMGPCIRYASEVEDFPDFTILDPVIELPAGLTVPAHESDSDLEVFFFAFSFSSSILREENPSGVTGFSMKAFRFFLMAYS